MRSGILRNDHSFHPVILSKAKDLLNRTPRNIYNEQHGINDLGRTLRRAKEQ